MSLVVATLVACSAASAAPAGGTARKASSAGSKVAASSEGAARQARVTALYEKARSAYAVQMHSEEDAEPQAEVWLKLFKAVPPSTSVLPCTNEELSEPLFRATTIIEGYEAEESHGAVRPKLHTVTIQVSTGATTAPAARRRLEVVYVQVAEDGSFAGVIAKGRLSADGKATIEGLTGDAHYYPDFETFGHPTYILTVDGAVVHIFRLGKDAPKKGLIQCSYYPPEKTVR